MARGAKINWKAFVRATMTCNENHEMFSVPYDNSCGSVWSDYQVVKLQPRNMPWSFAEFRTRSDQFEKKYWYRRSIYYYDNYSWCVWPKSSDMRVDLKFYFATTYSTHFVPWVSCGKKRTEPISKFLRNSWLANFLNTSLSNQEYCYIIPSMRFFSDMRLNLGAFARGI